MDQREQLLQFLEQCIDGKAHINITFFEQEDTRANAVITTDYFHDITGAEVVELPGKYLKAKKDRIELTHYYFGKGPIVIKI